MSKPSAALRFLYRTLPGRCILRLLVAPPLSKLAGAFLSTRLSRHIVPGFVKSNGMDLSEYPARAYDSFNDFFR